VHGLVPTGGGVHEDASVFEGPVYIRHHASNVPEGIFVCIINVYSKKIMLIKD
jgi:hypothetical protein